MPLINALVNYDRTEINMILKEYKTNNAINYKALLSIPQPNRIINLSKQDYKLTIGAIVVALTKVFETMNLSRPINAEQIIELADIIIESSEDDYIAIEDLLLFLQGLVRGKYGNLYESMDIPKFMVMFDSYRHNRIIAYDNIKYEQQCQYKVAGDTLRISDDAILDKEIMRNAMSDYLRSQQNNNNESKI